MTVADPDAEQISVVVPTRDRPGLLADCLRALRATLSSGDELIVVDSASRTASARAVTEKFGGQYIHLERPGASRARNAGRASAGHRIVCFVDDDVVVSEGWADAVRTAFTRNPSLGFITGRVLPPPGQEGVAHPVALYDRPEPFDLAIGTPSPYGISGNFAARRDVLERVGGFDELLGPGARFSGGGDDLDLFDRLLASGAPGRYEPAVLAYHDQWRSRSQRLTLDFHYGIGAGARLAKQMRLDRAFSRRIAKEFLWRWGVRDVAVSLRKGYEYGALAALFRVAGMVRGIVGGLSVPVAGGHFAPRDPAADGAADHAADDGRPAGDPR